MKKSLLLLIFLLLFFIQNTLHSNLPEPSDNASLSGYVVDIDTEETLIGATVYIEKTKLGSYTNKSGFFIMLLIFQLI